MAVVEQKAQGKNSSAINIAIWSYSFQNYLLAVYYFCQEDMNKHKYLI